jgi:hypothetical protein
MADQPDSLRISKSLQRSGDTCGPSVQAHETPCPVARKGGRPGRTVTALPGAVLLTGLLWLGSTAHALEINLSYDETIPGAIDSCEAELVDGVEVPRFSACRGPGNTFLDRTPELTAIMEAVAEHWEGIIRDNHSVDIAYAWLAPELGAPDALVLQRDADGRPTAARIRISVNIGLYYDPEPHNDDQFDMRPRLYRTTHPAEQMEAFSGYPLAAELEILETGFHGFGPGNDLWSVVAHEMGHALGMSGVDTDTGTCDPVNDPYFHVDPALVGGFGLGIKGYEFNVTDDDGVIIGTQVDCNHLALGGINECKPPDQIDTPITQIFNDPSTIEGFTVGECASHQALLWQGQFPLARSKPSVTDILAVGMSGSWQQVHLPRKYTMGSGNWHTASNWLGNRIPDADTDAYIVNRLPLFTVTEIDVTANAVTGSVFVSDENLLRVSNATLQVWDTITAAGPATTAGPLRPPPPHPPDDPTEIIPGPFSTVRIVSGGVLNAFDMVVESDARFELAAANAQASIGTLHNGGTISGFGTVQVGWQLQNTRLINANGGTLKFFTPPADEVIEVPVLDLDGPGFAGSSLAAVRAIDGDLVFDGIIANPVQAGVTVGSGRSIAFPKGWTQGFSGVAAHRLLLDGSAGEATIHGSSTLGGRTLVNGLGRFTGNVTIEPSAAVHLDIGGLVPGPGYDQINISQHAQLAGSLMLAFTGGFQPSFTDTFTLMTFAGRTGEFDLVEITDIESVSEGGLAFSVHYGVTDVVLSAGLQGGTPGAPNCTGKTTSEQAAIHGDIKNAAAYHGFPSVKAFMDALGAFCKP